MRRLRIYAGMLALLLLCLLPGMAMAEEAMSPLSVVKGHPLRPGDTIGIVAPATHSEDIALAPHLEALHAMGYKTCLAPSALHRYGYFAGTDSERADDINACFRDNRIDAILCLNGGYGSARILDRLDYAMIAAHPKLLIGFSDITALEAALYEKCHLVTLSGPLLITIPGSPYSSQQFRQAVTASAPLGAVTMPAGRSLQTVLPGKASGRLIGGNLSVIASLAGTPYELKGKGCILVLEDVGEESYRIDRMMNQLWQNGLLQQVEGIVYGDFTDCGHDPGDFTTDEVLTYYAKKAEKPAVRGLPFGHGTDKACLPIGAYSELDARPDGTAQFAIKEAHTIQKDASK